MAKDHGSIINYVLMGGAAYLAWQWYQSQPTVTPAVDTATGLPNPQPTIPNTTPASQSIGNWVGNGQYSKEAAFVPWLTSQGLSLNSVVTTSQWSDISGKYRQANPLSAPTPITPAPVAGTVGGVAYTGTKASYYLAVMKALANASNNSLSQTIDQWNWFMDHIGFAGFSTGGGDPDQIMAITGTSPGDAISPATYIDAIQKLGLLPYPTGLTGLAALAAGINRINRHPLAQSAPGNLYYPKPRKVVI